MRQAERDRLVALKKAKKKLMTEKQAAEEIGITERQVRRLLRKNLRRRVNVVGPNRIVISSDISRRRPLASPKNCRLDE